MADARTIACRDILERLSVVERLKGIRDELRALDCLQLAGDVTRAVRVEHRRVHVLADAIGAPLLPMRDLAAFVRAQLGQPINQPINATLLPAKLRAPRAWERDLSTALASRSSSPASSPAA